MFEDKDIQIRDLEAKLAVALDEKLRVEKRLERALHSLEDLERRLVEITAEVHGASIAGGRW